MRQEPQLLFLHLWFADWNLVGARWGSFLYTVVSSE